MAEVTLDMDRTQALAERLKRVPGIADAVRRRGQGTVDEEAWQVASALADVQQSTARLFGELVPGLLSAEPEGQEAAEILNEIGEEYRHILYHIRDTKLYGYLFANE